jgi:hypothetical protein
MVEKSTRDTHRTVDGIDFEWIEATLQNGGEVSGWFPTVFPVTSGDILADRKYVGRDGRLRAFSRTQASFESGAIERTWVVVAEGLGMRHRMTHRQPACLAAMICAHDAGDDTFERWVD